jgi:hypothetical protein
MKQLIFRPVRWLIAVMASVFSVGTLPVSAAVNITVTVHASDPNKNNELSYRWRATDGQIVDRNEPSTQWTLPAGPGLHFAYVLVSNGKGGYTERRIIVNTDGLSAVQPHAPVNLVAPAAPTPSAEPVPFRNWLGGGLTSAPHELVAKPTNLKVALPRITIDATTLSAPIISEQSITSLMGDFVLNNFLPPNNTDRPAPQYVPELNIHCFVKMIEIFRCFGFGANLMPLSDEVIDNEANQTNRIDPVFTRTTGQDITWYTGSVRLSDGSTCGTENEFFGVTSTATAELVETFTGMLIPGSRVRANSWGQYSIPVKAQTRQMHLSVVIRCEGADPVTPANSGTPINAPPDGDTASLDFGVVTIGGSAPVVSSMSVTPATISSKFDDPARASQLPSDIVPLRPAKFLAMKGLDTRLSGCLYYQTIGAVKGCDAEGNFLGGAIRFDDWKRTVKIDEYAPPGTAQYRAVFVNRVDLNLTRDHHSVSYKSNSNPMGATAGYVCNHPGPPFDPTDSSPTHQKDVDTAIDNALAGRNLVACVAMDYSVSPGVNNNLPFTRFLIFGPNGKLLPSVNLDGRGEKFVPGTCTVCHGGSKYAGKFPEDGKGTADLNAHFLPFDIGNFEFHTPVEPTKQAQQEAIYQLNQNVLKTNPNKAEIDLINGDPINGIKGWYSQGDHTQRDEDFAPATNANYYNKVIARNCRTCHIAQRDQGSIKDLNFSSGGSGAGQRQWLKEVVCGQTDDLLRAFAMPNSQVTFDRFWLSQDAVRAFRTQTGFSDCQNPKAPLVP